MRDFCEEHMSLGNIYYLHVAQPVNEITGTPSAVLENNWSVVSEHSITKPGGCWTQLSSHQLTDELLN